MLPGFFFPNRMSLASSSLPALCTTSCCPPCCMTSRTAYIMLPSLPACTVHYIMLPGFFFPSRMSLASFTLAAMKLLPPGEGQQ